MIIDNNIDTLIALNHQKKYFNYKPMHIALLERKDCTKIIWKRLDIKNYNSHLYVTYEICNKKSMKLFDLGKLFEKALKSRITIHIFMSLFRSAIKSL